jgi:hypothetical protein
MKIADRNRIPTVLSANPDLQTGIGGTSGNNCLLDQPTDTIGVDPLEWVD